MPMLRRWLKRSLRDREAPGLYWVGLKGGELWVWPPGLCWGVWLWLKGGFGGGVGRAGSRRCCTSASEDRLTSPPVGASGGEMGKYQGGGGSVGITDFGDVRE